MAAPASTSIERRRLATRLWRRRAASRPVPGKAGSRNSTNTYPLSAGQERLWCLQELEPQAGLFNIVEGRLVDGDVDRAVLEDSINGVIERHEALRTIFPVVAGAPVQKVLPTLRLAVSLVDLSPVSEAAAFSWMQQLARAHGRVRFDLARGPLLSILLIRLDPRRHVVWLAFHHIIADGWSTMVFERDLKAIYERMQSGRSTPLPPLPMQYRHFTEWQRASPPPSYAASLARWRERLRTVPPLLTFGRGSVALRRTRRAERHAVDYGATLIEALGGIARRDDLTPFMILLAAFAVALSAVSRQRDLVIGTPVTERANPVFDGLIGYFLNTLPLRLSITAPSWQALLRSVRAAVLDAQDDSSVPFQAVVHDARAAGVDRALFNAWFTLVDVPAFGCAPVLRPWTPLPVHSGVAQFDIACVLHTEGAAITGFIEYDPGVVPVAMAQAVVTTMKRALRAIADASIEPVFPDLVESAGGEGALAVPPSFAL